jgi:hypothetical protein
MPGRWWVRVNGALAASKPVPGEEVEAVLTSVGFHSQSWRSWRIE